MKSKKILSLCLAGALSVTALCYPLPSSATVDYTYKIDEALAEKLESIGNNDTVDVSIWFNPLDQEDTQREVLKSVINEVEEGKLDEEIVDYFYSSNELVNGNEEEALQDISTSDAQEIVSIEYDVISNLYQEYNNECIEGIPLSEAVKNNATTYVSSYVPNVEMTLTKNQVYSIISDEDVESVYLHSIVAEEENEVLPASTPRSLPNITTDDVYSYTGIDYMKNTANVSGAGVKIGLLTSGKPDTTLSCFSNANTNNRIVVLDNTLSVNNQATFAAAQLVGKVGSLYEGIAINSTLYCAGTDELYTDSWKDSLDLLLNQKVNIINIGIAIDGNSVNTYDDTSKYIDAIVNTEPVTIVRATGENYPSGANSVMPGSMAYNEITVGMYRMNYSDVSPLSAYNNSSTTQYKPDLVAPYDMTVYYNSTTSAKLANPLSSANVVTGSLALLMNKAPEAKVNSTFAKALLLNGTTYLGTENQKNSSTEFVALARNSGTGILNVKNSYDCYATRNWVVGTNSADTQTGLAGEFLVDSQKRQVRVTLCSMKDNSFNRNGQVLTSDFAQYKVTVRMVGGSSTDVWTSVCRVDNKCTVVFTPTVSAYYTVTLERLTGSGTATDLACVFTSAF